VLGVTVLAIAASPLLTINLANPGPDDMPEDFVAHRANEVLVEDFGWTDTATMVVITGAAGDADAVDTLAAEVESDPGFADTTVDWRGTCR
jgi:RND superfamily putative drug exporter